MAHDLVTELLQYSSLACFMAIWQLCANLLIPNCLRSNLSYSPLAALELYVNKAKTLSDAAQNIELSPKKLPVRFVNTSQRSSSPIFLPYLMGTVSVLKTDIKKCDNTALTTYFYIVRAVLSLKFETIYRKNTK